MNKNVDDLIEKLDSSDISNRRWALKKLLSKANQGGMECKDTQGWINLHVHTFFSYNGYGYSPSRFAWEAYVEGLEVAGIVDFDCLDGAEEFHEAGRLLNMKSTAGFETRVFVEEYSNRVINSPKEPGVFYLVGTGFVAKPTEGSRAAATVDDMTRRARERNVAMLDRLKSHLEPVQVDYHDDIVPLTVAGNVTERHMVTAIESRAREVFGGGDELVEYWTNKLGVDREEVKSVQDDPVRLKGLVRSRLMKHGGVGYVKPDNDSFPPLEEVVGMTLDEGALPSGCWLDGASEGEANPREHFAFLKDKGCVSITMIPDRNWNVPSDERQSKVSKLDEAIEAAQDLNMPILVGTEMNKYGNRLVDDFESDALAPHLDTFRQSAHIVWGHTLLKMTAGVGYVGEWADSRFGNDVSAKNDFFREMGSGGYPDPMVMGRLSNIGPTGSVQEFREALSH
ncbi:MAG: hypothetical protein ACOC0A_01510 [Planctomycetota bacterium]